MFGKTRLENSQAAASYMRLLKYKMERGEDISSSLEHAFEIVKHLISNERIDLIQADKFFFYGAVGYVGTDALSIGFEIEALQNYLQIINQPVLELDEEKIKNQTDLGIEYLRDEQMSLDGSWTKMIQVSSDLYGAFMIFLYEYTGILESKIVNAKAIMSDIWTRQKKNGAFAGYPGGPDDNSINVLIYMAAKMTLENENSSRMVALEKAIKRNGGSHEVRALAYPFMALFGLHPSVKYIPRKGLKTLLSLKDSLPWIRVMAYPVLYLLAKGKIHKLNKDKYPIRIFSHGKTYYPFLKKSRKNDYVGEAEFKDWLTSNMNPDGTLFDYTPTTIPALMALSQLGEDQDELFSKGIKTLESFQVKTKTGLYQSPGEASIGETYVIINALLDMGVSADDPMIVNAEKFLLSLQQEAGGFGFSKNNTHYPDSDDTSNVIYVFKRLNDIRGQVDPRLTRRIEKGLEVLLTFQNKDGGFGTWEKDPISKITKGLNFIGITPKVVLAESIVEHTARIALNLASYTENPIYEKSYNAAIKYLLKTQLADGSYPGTWFVNYLFGTSMVVTALATAPQTPKIKRAIEKALRFILKHQRADGGFSESVKSFDAKKVVYLKQSSPAQTGLILSQLLMFLKEENGTHAKLLDPFLRKGVQFLSDTQQDDGLWHDKTWSGVTFPGLEYLYYQYVQEVEPLHVLGMYEELMRTFE
ncbi:MAG: hypothetical protein HON90_03970 [Halobacteriovoraceae bacterium]|nr:hypothetical protein [Halobacteriovoraceae bacterium]